MKRLNAPLILLVASNLAFVLLFLLISFSNRLALDDFHFMANVHEYGVIGGTFAEHGGWSTRWMSVLLNHSMLFWHEQSEYALFFFGLISLVVFTASVFWLIRNILKLQNTDHVNVLMSVNVAIFIVNIIYLLTPARGETWFWLCSACTYLWSVIMLFAGTAWLISQRGNLAALFVAVFAFTYIGGSNEPLALLVMLILLVVLLFMTLTKRTFALARNIMILRTSIAFFFCLSSFVILRMGVGNATREAFFENIGILHALTLNFKMSAITLMKILPPLWGGALVLCLPALYAGGLSRKNVIMHNPGIKFIYILISYIIFLYLYQLPVTYKTQDIVAVRAAFPLVIATLLCTCGVYFIAGTRMSSGEKLKRALIMLPIVAVFLLNLFYLFATVPATRGYARAYDERMAILKKPHTLDTVIALKRLPPPGMLCSAEISDDTSHYYNKHLKAGLGLNFYVRAEKKTAGNNE